MKNALWIGGLLCLSYATVPRPVAAQTAQGELVVPQINVFSVATTVSAPDRGRMSLGGVGRAADVRNEFGVPLLPGLARDRGISSTRSVAGADVRVSIIDFNEMEESLARRAGASGPQSRDFAGSIRRYAVTPPANENAQAKDAAAKPVADDELASKVAHAADLLKRGQDAEERGKHKVAALYYKSVVSLDVTSSAKLAQERLRSLETKLAGR